MKSKHQQLKEKFHKYLIESEKHLRACFVKDEEFETFYYKYSNVHHKLSLFFNEINTQLSVLKKVLFNIKNETEGLSINMFNQLEEKKRLLKDLSDILEYLKTKEINKALVKENKASLYDFINKEQVALLYSKGNNHIDDINNLLKKLKSFSFEDGFVETKYKIFSKSINELKGLWIPDPNINKEPLSEISQLSNRVKGVYNKILYNQFNENNEDEKYRIMENNVKKHLAMIRTNLLTIESNITVTKAMFKKMENFYESSKLHFMDLENLTKSLPNKINEIENIKNKTNLDSIHNSKIMNNETIILFEQIKELTIWYSFFPIAYDNMLLEIMRRQNNSNKQKSRLKEIELEFKQYYEEEEEKRQSFFEEFGRFLPSNLLPQLIINPTPKFSFKLLTHLSSSTNIGGITDQNTGEIQNIRLEKDEIDRINNETKQYLKSKKDNHNSNNSIL